MKVAVIGTGFWGRNHVREYCAIGHEVIACDLNNENLSAVKKEFPIKKTVSSAGGVLADKETEAVSICVPNQLHYTLAKQALESGKHVLLEKPMTLSHKQAVELVRLAENKKLVLNVGHIFRFNNAVKKLKEMVQKKELGKVFLCKLSWTNLEKIFPDRDILFDLAPHPFDIVNFVFEKNPQEVYAIGKDFRREGGEEAAFVNAVLDGILVNLEISWVTPRKTRTITVVGSKKTAFLDAITQNLEVFNIATGKQEKIKLHPSNPLREEIVQFIDCIENSSTSPASGKAGAEVIHIIEKTLESLKQKRIITI